MKLLTIGDQNTKLGKSDAKGTKYLSAGVSLAPWKTSGIGNVCPSATVGCRAVCLTFSGRGQMGVVQKARANKTKFFFKERETFIEQLKKEITSFNVKCKKLGNRAAVRLNLLSDLDWVKLAPGLMEEFSDVQFYDYTKVWHRALRFIRGELPKNYHITLSRSELNDYNCKTFLNLGGNVAAVFRDELPKTWFNHRVVGGDESDLRFLNRKATVIGLLAKGSLARNDESGFVIDL